MSLARAFVLGVVLSASACSSDRSTIEIRARASLEEAQGFAGLVLWLNGREFTATDFSPSSGSMRLFTGVPNSGQLEIRLELHQDGDLVAEGMFSLDLLDNFEWGMDVFRQPSDPGATCIGCAGTAGFLLVVTAQNEVAEAVWFAWGGKRRGSDVVF
jgi:hypothetical protein